MNVYFHYFQKHFNKQFFFGSWKQWKRKAFPSHIPCYSNTVVYVPVLRCDIASKYLSVTFTMKHKFTNHNKNQVTLYQTSNKSIKKTRLIFKEVNCNTPLYETYFHLIIFQVLCQVAFSSSGYIKDTLCYFYLSIRYGWVRSYKINGVK